MWIPFTVPRPLAQLIIIRQSGQVVRWARKVKVLQSAYIEADPKNARTLPQEVFVSCPREWNRLHPTPHSWPLRHPHTQQQRPPIQLPGTTSALYGCQGGGRGWGLTACVGAFSTLQRIFLHIFPTILWDFIAAHSHTHTHTHPFIPHSLYVSLCVCVLSWFVVFVVVIYLVRACVQKFFHELDVDFSLFFFLLSSACFSTHAKTLSLLLLLLSFPSFIYVNIYASVCARVCAGVCVCVFVNRYILASSYKSYARIHTFPQWGDDSL